MLVIDLYTLQTIYVLNLIHDVLLNSGRTHNSEDIARSDSTVRERSSSADTVTILYEQLLTCRNEILTLLTSLGSNGYLTVVTLKLRVDRYLTVDFTYHSRVTWVTCLEELSYSWETTGDIACTAYSTWNLHESDTRRDRLTILYYYVTTYREVITTD